MYMHYICLIIYKIDEKIDFFFPPFDSSFNFTFLFGPFDPSFKIIRSQIYNKSL
jgi:hypothetical protein